MTNGRAPDRRWSRESRLLVLTILVCAASLFALARLRFPEAPPVETAARPLERLAARASYDSLASDVQAAEAKIREHVVVLRVTRQGSSSPRELADVFASPEVPLVTHVPALRTGSDAGLAIIGGGARVELLGGGEVVRVTAADPLRRVARLRLAPVPNFRPLPSAAPAAPAYVLAVEGTPAGASFRPVFLGGGDRFSTARWRQPLLPLGGVPIAAGTLFFNFDGQFIGAAVVEHQSAAIVPADDLQQAVARMPGETAPSAAGWAGISVQPLTAALSAATGAQAGVVVSDVDPAGPASAVLQPADVIATLDGRATNDPDDLLLQIAERLPGDAIELGIVRGHQPATARVTLEAAGVAGPPRQMDFQREPGGGTRVVAGRRPGLPGLAAGDVIVRAGDVNLPSPVQLRRVIATAAAPYVVLAVRRDGRTRIVALPVTPGDREPPR